MDCLANAIIFSSIDLGQAYYQIKLAEGSRDATAFSTKEGQFRFNRIPFGLATAPATFQKLIHDMLAGLIFKGVIVYLDDILVYEKSVNEHNILEEVFNRIRILRLRINPEKCKFYQKMLVFLEHTINAEKIKTNETKIREIKVQKNQNAHPNSGLFLV